MTSYPKKLRLVGGPSDGMTFTYATKPRMYLTITGEPLPAARGDAFMAGRGELEGCYVFQASINGSKTHYAYRGKRP